MRLAVMIGLGFWGFIFAFNTVAVEPLPGKAVMFALFLLTAWLFNMARTKGVR